MLPRLTSSYYSGGLFLDAFRAAMYAAGGLGYTRSLIRRTCGAQDILALWCLRAGDWFRFTFAVCCARGHRKSSSHAPASKCAFVVGARGAYARTCCAQFLPGTGFLLVLLRYWVVFVLGTLCRWCTTTGTERYLPELNRSSTPCLQLVMVPFAAHYCLRGCPDPLVHWGRDLAASEIAHLGPPDYRLHLSRWCCLCAAVAMAAPKKSKTAHESGRHGEGGGARLCSNGLLDYGASSLSCGKLSCAHRFTARNPACWLSWGMVAAHTNCTSGDDSVGIAAFWQQRNLRSARVERDVAAYGVR